MSKPFSRQLYNENNQRAITKTTEILKTYGYTLHDASEAYKSHDAIYKRNNEFLKVELEVSTAWNTTHFPFPVLTCPYRKAQSKADLYIIYNHDLSSYGIIPMKNVHTSPVIKKNTKYTKDEPFFYVHISNVDFYINNIITTPRYLTF
jgi:hypothetical protein